MMKTREKQIVGSIYIYIEESNQDSDFVPPKGYERHVQKLSPVKGNPGYVVKSLAVGIPYSFVSNTRDKSVRV